MNSATTHHHAGRKAGFTARGFVRVVLACALALGAVTGTGAAWAQQYGDRRDDDSPRHERRGEHFRLPSLDRDGRRSDVRERDRDDRRPVYGDRYQEQPQPERRSSSGRLTPDERRDLRRQINEANIDLYPQRR